MEKPDPPEKILIYTTAVVGPPISSDEEKEEWEKREYKNSRGEKDKLFGCTVTLLANWMGQQGWTADEAYRVFDSLGVDYLRDTVKKQISYGRNPKYQKEVVLSTSQMEKLEAMKDDR